MTESTDEKQVRPAPTGRRPDLGGRSEKSVAAILTAPGQLIMLFIVLFPAAMAIYIGFTEWTPTSGSDVWGAYKYWHWFDGYWEALTDGTFWSAMGRTVLFLVVTVGAEFLIGFALAMLFLKEFRGRGIWMLFFLLPMMVVPAVSGFVFFMLFQVDGPVNEFLSIVSGSTVAIPWLEDPQIVLWSAMVVDIWQWTPLMFLILLSGLVALPEDQMSQARILGASGWHQFRYLILPMMKPIILIALIIRSIEVFKVFDAPFMLTQGGPGDASTTISIWLYREVIINSRWGFACAAAIIVLILVTIAGAFAVRPIEQAQESTLEELERGAGSGDDSDDDDLQRQAIGVGAPA